jgi:Lanthionine synthetase C-like protein
VLYTPELFESLTDQDWDAERAARRIREIVADADNALRGPKLLWKANDWDGWHGTSPMKNLYVGAAGLLWALDRLRRLGHAETQLDLAALALQTLELFRMRPDYMKGMKLPAQRDSSLACGETGILLVAWRLAPHSDLEDAIYERVRANVHNEVEEVMWGSPGTLLAARAMLEWTGDERWHAAWDESAAALLARRNVDALWTQRMYGQEFEGLQPWHGLVGNVHSLRAMLDDDREAALLRDTAAALERTAVVENGHANWPYRVRPELASPDGTIRMQFCTGAPGVVATASDYLEEELLLAGAELAWNAGPPGMEKGPALCHGTAGTGYAFLKVFERTQDERWLQRARRFAMHALQQVERRDEGRYSLWTGDIGAALFAADCIDVRAELPVFDVL